MIDSLEAGEKLIEIVSSCSKYSETSVLDYKLIPHDYKNEPCEFYRDILGLLNSYERPDEDRFLVYGVEDTQKVALGYNKGLALDSAAYEEWFKKISPQPSIEFHSIDASEIIKIESGVKEFSFFYIPSSNFGKVYELNTCISNPIKDSTTEKESKRWRRYEPGTSFYRHGSKNYPMLEEIREIIRSTRKQEENIDYAILKSSLDYKGIAVLSIASIFGAWNEANEFDRRIISRSAEVPFEKWKSKAIELSFRHAGLFRKVGSKWHIAERTSLLNLFGKQIDTCFLDGIKEYLMEALSSIRDEDDDDSSIQASCSIEMRRGIAEFLAILGTGKASMGPFSSRYQSNFIYQVMATVIANDDWKVLNVSDRLFPLLAQASPSSYLLQIERALPDGAIKHYLSRNETSSFGSSQCHGFFTGIRFAARTKNEASQAVSLLIELHAITTLAASHLTSILLPWFPQIALDAEARASIGKSLVENDCWDVLIKLLPGETTSAIGAEDPEFLPVCPLPEEICLQDFLMVSKAYIEAAISACSKDHKKAIEMTDHIRSLITSGYMKQFCEAISSSYRDAQDDIRFELWARLKYFATAYGRKNEAEDQVDDTSLQCALDAASHLEPQSKHLQSKYWFIYNDFNYRKNADWRTNEILLHDNRVSSLEELYSNDGWAGFSNLVEDSALSDPLGRACASVSFANEIFSRIRYRSSETQYHPFLKSFYWASGILLGDSAINIPNEQHWNNQEIGFLLSCLPYSKAVWDRADALPDDIRLLFIKNSRPCIDPKDPDEASGIITAYLQVERSLDAIDLCFRCLEKEIALEPSLVFAVIKQVPNDGTSTMVSYYFESLVPSIEAQIPGDELAYEELRLISQFENKGPLFLMRYMSRSYKFFYFVLSSTYKPKGSIAPKDDQPSWLAGNSFSALWNWRIIPGMTNDGSIDQLAFDQWVDGALALSQDGGLADICERTIGKCLYHAPADPNGLFINEHIAKYLDVHPNARKGFSTESVNSLGAHFLDGTGKFYFDLSDTFEDRAKQLEAKGMLGFAATVRHISESFRKDGEDEKHENSY